MRRPIAGMRAPQLGRKRFTPKPQALAHAREALAALYGTPKNLSSDELLAMREQVRLEAEAAGRDPQGELALLPKDIV
jgi:hypothetical protein